MEVATSAGVWTLRRRWAPEQLREQSAWRRFRNRVRGTGRSTAQLAEGADPAAGCLDGGFGAIAAGILFALALVFVLVVVVPVLIAIGELALLLLLAIGGLVGRLVFKRPWAVEAISPDGRRYEWPIVGWRRSGRVLQAVADDLRTTGTPPSLMELDRRDI